MSEDRDAVLSELTSAQLEAVDLLENTGEEEMARRLDAAIDAAYRLIGNLTAEVTTLHASLAGRPCGCATCVGEP